MNPTITAPSVEQIQSKRQIRIDTAPKKYRGILARCWSSKPSKPGCLKAMCLECVGFEIAAITQCTSYACPLFKVRPYQKL